MHSSSEVNMRRITTFQELEPNAADNLSEPGKGDAGELIAKAVEIASRRRQTLSQLRSALESGDERRALELARKYCGLTNDEKSDRVN
jgi:hypothetical protein